MIDIDNNIYERPNGIEYINIVYETARDIECLGVFMECIIGKSKDDGLYRILNLTTGVISIYSKEVKELDKEVIDYLVKETKKIFISQVLRYHLEEKILNSRVDFDSKAYQVYLKLKHRLDENILKEIIDNLYEEHI